MSTVIITGGTGLIGTALSNALLKKEYNIIILSRSLHHQKTVRNLRYAAWDTEKQIIDQEAIRSADYIIHLAGAGVADKRWTKKRKQEILDSRVNSSKLIVDSLKIIPNKVKAVISSSAIGWYLAPGLSERSGEGSTSLKLKETDPPANNFSGTTCKLWEKSIDPVAQMGKRLVKLRTGIVLSKEGGAIKGFLKPLKFGVAAILGNGKQMISWIHLNDLVNMYIAAVENEKLNGVYNAVAPNPVSNKELIIQLAKSRKKFFIPVHIPSFVLKLILGEMSVEVLRSSAVSCKKIENAGFVFQFPGLHEALENLK